MRRGGRDGEDKGGRGVARLIGGEYSLVAMTAFPYPVRIIPPSSTHYPATGPDNHCYVACPAQASNLSFMEVENHIQERLARYKEDLPRLDCLSLVRKHITSGEAFILPHDNYFSLRDRIAREFGVHTNDVFVVGSAKLGFSIAPNKRYRPFGDTSDIDVAVVSQSLFDQIWKEVFEYRAEVGYWPAEQQFASYLFKGWIRPDKLPPARKFELASRWWTFFRELTQSGDVSIYPIKAGLYKSHYFLEAYQSICVKQCQTDIDEEA